MRYALGEPLFSDRDDAGRRLAPRLEGERRREPVVVGLARGGVAVAAVVARALGAPLDVVAVRKVGHPFQREYALGAVAPGDGLYLRAGDELEQPQLDEAVAAARSAAAALDRRLHAGRAPVELGGRTCVLVDDGLATGATMIAAIRWARSRGAARVVAAVPVAAAQSVPDVAAEADAFVCPHVRDDFFALSAWYGTFQQVGDERVLELLGETAPAAPERA